MALLRNFHQLLPILNESERDFIFNPVANSSTIAAGNHADADDHAFSNILCDTSRILFQSDPLPPPVPELSDEDEPTDSGVILSSLKFYAGRSRGQNCSYNGYLYSHNKSRANGHSYWDCKDRRTYNPPCKGRLSTLGASVTKENPHCHPPSVKEVDAEQFLAKIRTDNTVETAGNVIRQHLRGTSDAVKSALPTEYNMKRQVNRYRHKTRGHPAASATCARDVEIPLSSESGHSDGGLFVLDDVITSNGKRVVA
jgi:hypothetical protein